MSDTENNVNSNTPDINLVIKEKIAEWVESQGEKTIAEILKVDSIWYTRDRIEDLGLSNRARSCLSWFLDPPLSSPNNVHFTVDEILNLPIEYLWSMRNLGSKCFIEVLGKLYETTFDEEKEENSEVKRILEIGKELLVEKKRKITRYLKRKANG